MQAQARSAGSREFQPKSPSKPSKSPMRMPASQEAGSELVAAGHRFGYNTYYAGMSYMAKVLKNIERPARSEAAALRELAARADPSILPAVRPTTGSEIVTVRLSAGLVDQLDAEADAEGTTRKVIITRALAAAGYRVPAHDLEDRTPRRRRRAA